MYVWILKQNKQVIDMEAHKHHSIELIFIILNFNRHTFHIHSLLLFHMEEGKYRVSDSFSISFVKTLVLLTLVNVHNTMTC